MRNPTVSLEYSTDPLFGTVAGSVNLGSSSLSGTATATGLSTGTTYYFRVKSVWSAGNNPEYSSDTLYSGVSAGITTQTPLNVPYLNGGRLNVTDETTGSGTLTFPAIEGAAGYQYQVSDDGQTWGSSVASGFSESGGTVTLAFSNLGNKYLRLQAVAASAGAASYQYANSAWTNEGTNGTEIKVPLVQISYVDARVEYAALPHIDDGFDSRQIRRDGDFITKKYADTHYSGQSVSPSQLPTVSVYDSSAAAGDDAHITTPKYVEGRIGALNITEIKAASSGDQKFAGVTTASSGEDYYLVTNKAMRAYASNASNLSSGTVANARLNKAKTDGTAGIVSVSTTNDGNGLKITGSAGQIEVNFAVYDTTASSSGTTVVSPAYLESRITALSLGTASGYAVGTAQGQIPVLGAGGKLSIDMMPARVIGGEYLGEVVDQAAMVAKTNATVGDFVKRTDTGTYWMLGVDGETAYGTAANWFEYAGAVTSVNGAIGAVTQADLGLETTLTAASDTAFPSSKAVATYVTGLGYLTSSSSLNASKLSSGTVNAARLPWSLAAWTDGTTHYSTTGDGLVQQTYLKKAFDDYGFGDAAKKGLAASITASEAGLVTGAQVATYVTGLGYLTSSSNLNASKLSSGTVNAARLPWSLAAWTDGTTHYSTTGDRLVQQTYLKKAFDDYGFGDAAKKGVAASITASEAGLVTGAQVATYVGNLGYDDVGAAAASHKQAITTIYATGTTLFAGIVTAFGTSYTASSEDYKVPTAYAVKQALAGKANTADASATPDAGKLAKYNSDGFLDPNAFLWDENFNLDDMGDGNYVVSLNTGTLLDGYATETWADGRYAKQGSFGVAEWSSSGTYVPNDFVVYKGKFYQKTGNGTNPPGLLGSGWTEVSYVNTLRYATTITGDGSAATFAVSHPLGVQDVDVEVIEASSGNKVFCAMNCSAVGTVQIGFGAAPASGKVYRVIIRK